MPEGEYDIERYDNSFRDDVLALSMRAWEPVFPKLREAVPEFVYECFYPDGWRARQTTDVGTFLDSDEERIWVAHEARRLLGFVGARVHPEDNMGEIYILAVDPAAQRRGVATALMDKANTALRDEGLAMVMVETGGDPGHSASRATYEAAGFQRWPVARYFKPL